MRGGVVAAILAFAIAGCTEPTATADESGDVDELQPQAVHWDLIGTRCQLAVLHVPVEAAHAQSFLPDGFEARPGLPGIPIPTDDSKVYVALSGMACGELGEPVEDDFNDVRIPVRPPAEAAGREPVQVDYYVLETYDLFSFEVFDTLDSVEWSVLNTSRYFYEYLFVEVMTNDVNEPGNRLDAIYQFRFDPLLPLAHPSTQRLWQRTPLGIGYFEIHADREAAGGPATCAMRPGSVAAAVTLRTSCADAFAIGTIDASADMTRSFHFFPAG